MKKTEKCHHQKYLIMVLLFGVLLMSGCGSANDIKPQPVEKLDEEKRLVLYTSHKEEVYEPIISEFEERTGIWVEVHSGGTTEMLERIKKESDQHIADVMFGGGVESYEAYQDYFDPYICEYAKFLNPDFLSENHKWTTFTELPIVFIYNNKLVSESEAPSKWGEFLDDTWKGKISFADPGNSGTSYTALATMIQVLQKEPELIMEQFAAALDGCISENSKAVVDEVAAGTRLVGITLEETAQKKIASGADISMVYPAEGTSAVPDGSALIKGAPHQKNAELFIDFTVSNDVQNLVMDQLYRRSVRLDLQKSNSQLEDISKIRMIDFDLELAGSGQKDILEIWNRKLEEQADK